jgi:hypothetical protein
MMRLHPIQTALIFCVSALAQRSVRMNNVQVPLDESEFQSCSHVEEIARGFDPKIADRVYSLELFSKSKGDFAWPFATDTPFTQVTNWIGAHQREAYPFAMFYAVYGRYRFRCRDAQGNLSETAGPGGDPLEFTIRGGTAQVLHFKFNVDMAQIYAVTSIPLENIEAADLLARVTQLLHARYVFLYVRGDPWFYGYARESTPFIFSDGSKAISEEAYRRSQTLTCMTSEGCRIGLSWP